MPSRMRDILDEYHDAKLKKTRRDNEIGYYMKTTKQLRETVEDYRKELAEQRKRIEYLERVLQEHKDNWAIVKRSRLTTRATDIDWR